MDFMHAGEIIRGSMKIPTNIQVTSEGVKVGSINKTIYSWDLMTDVEIAGPESRTSRVTATRLVTLGVLAFGVKKDTSRTLVIMSMKSGEVATIVFTKKSEPEVRALFAPHIGRLQTQPQTQPAPPVSERMHVDAAPQTSRVDQLTNLANLLDKGIISDSEFENLKAEILAPGKKAAETSSINPVTSMTELVNVSIRPSDGIWEPLEVGSFFFRLYVALYWIGQYDLQEAANYRIDDFLASRSTLEIPFKMAAENAFGIVRSAAGSKYEVLVDPPLPPHLLGEHIQPLDVTDGTPITVHLLDHSQIHFGILSWKDRTKTVDILHSLGNPLRTSKKMIREDRQKLSDLLDQTPHKWGIWVVPLLDYLKVNEQLKSIDCITQVGIHKRLATNEDQIFYNGKLLNQRL